MNGHPGGEENTIRMLVLGGLHSGSRILDMGAGAGETVRFLRSIGYNAEGIDIEPRSHEVRHGDLLHTPYLEESFDGIISQCAFWLSGDIAAAFAECARILKPEGMLMVSDLCFEPMQPAAEAAGFRVVHLEDMTAQWREYYIEAIWRGTADNCHAKGKCSYQLMVCRKE